MLRVAWIMESHCHFFCVTFERNNTREQFWVAGELNKSREEKGFGRKNREEIYENGRRDCEKRQMQSVLYIIELEARRLRDEIAWGTRTDYKELPGENEVGFLFLYNSIEIPSIEDEDSKLCVRRLFSVSILPKSFR
ncbi:uncharacterized protein LOC111006494 isoform X2 [Momordica charantia]|uniref:Uncharacterized protein LOC111006494 isoform X2 n=1 Tax=Momordica charantia TaxID=3673 RepID=A0A6J1BX60_MOMCH|nr:uncharacterized protein LOC111006494 isoform X2 [Momordica charantia]XP_022134162.1 uncharacterized protein LOC111006494 isoform X2 [Momordica charantia]